MRPYRKVIAIPSYPFAIHNLTLQSGKSSFILAILRLLDLKSGQIILDSHDLATLPRPLIREKITCLIQEPFLFSGSSMSETISLRFLIFPLKSRVVW